MCLKKAKKSVSIFLGHAFLMDRSSGIADNLREIADKSPESLIKHRKSLIKDLKSPITPESSLIEVRDTVILQCCVHPCDTSCNECRRYIIATCVAVNIKDFSAEK